MTRNLSDPTPWAAPPLQRKVASARRPTEPENKTDSGEAQRAAEQLLEEARRRAEQEAKVVLEQARQRGLAEGRQQAAEEVAEQERLRGEQQVQRLQELGKHLETEWQRTLAQLESCLAEVVWLLVDKLLGRVERASLPEREIRQAVVGLVDQQTVLRVAPLDQTPWSADFPLRIETDDSLALGEFRLVSPQFSIDGSFERRREHLQQAVAEVLGDS